MQDTKTQLEGRLEGIYPNADLSKNPYSNQQNGPPVLEESSERGLMTLLTMIEMSQT